MTTKNRQLFSVQLLQITDAALVCLSFYVAILIKGPFTVLLSQLSEALLDRKISEQPFPGLSSLNWMMFIVVPFIPLVAELFGFYRHPLLQKFRDAFWKIFWAVILVNVATGMLSFFLKLPYAARPVIFLSAALGICLISVRSFLVGIFVEKRAVNENSKEPVVVAGNLKDVEEWLASVPLEIAARWKIVGKYDLASGMWVTFQDLLQNESVQRVIFPAAHSEFSQLSTAIEMCEVRGIEAWIAADFIRTKVARPTFDSIASRPMLVLRSTPEVSWSLMVKLLMDKVGALFLLVISIPLWLVAAIGIKLQSPGPVFYRQERAGRYGKPFWMWKFRTMIVDADQKLEALKKQAGNQMSGPVFKLENDPRIFPLGHFLRKFSIDEFPQFINVLMGDMSLVGPRPMAIYELPKIERSEHRRKLSVKPGLTCIWQVSGRNHITNFDDWVQLDLQYIDNWSLWLDVKLLVMTIPAVLFARGSK